MQKVQIRHLIILSILLICCTPVFSDKKIYTLSDIHVMSPLLLDSPTNLAWQEYLADSKTLVDYSKTIFDKLCSQIITDKPDLLLIVGDMTKDGEIESHEYVINKLTQIESAGIPVFVIPGNHDRGWQQNAKIYRNNIAEDTKYTSMSRFSNYYKDFGYGEGSELHGTTLTYATEIWPGLTLIGIDSGQTAAVDEDAVTWACAKAKEAKDKGQQVIAMMHHALLPHIYAQELIHVNSVVSNNEEIGKSDADRPLPHIRYHALHEPTGTGDLRCLHRLPYRLPLRLSGPDVQRRLQQTKNLYKIRDRNQRNTQFQRVC